MFSVSTGLAEMLLGMDLEYLDIWRQQKLIVRLNHVCFQTGLSKSTIYDKIKQGNFPKPVRLGARAVGWRQSDVDGWIDACAAKA